MGDCVFVCFGFAQLFFGDDGEIVVKDPIETFLQLNIVGSDGIDGDMIIGGVSMFADDGPSKFASKAKEEALCFLLDVSQ